MKILDLMPAEIRNEIGRSVREHAEILRELLKTSAGHGRQYLILTNAGAAVALMAFMSANEAVRTLPIAWISLCMFFLGIVASGVLAFLDFHARHSDFESWLTDSEAFFANKIEFEDLYENLNSRNRRVGKRPVIAGYVAFGCFVVGGLLAGSHFLRAAMHPMQGPYGVLGNAPWCELDNGSNVLFCDFYSKQQCEQLTPAGNVIGAPHRVRSQCVKPRSLVP